MNYGFYLSASGAMTNLHRQDVFSNNLSNVNTIGFKPDAPSIQQRAPEAVEDNLGFDVSHRLLERLGGGVLVGPGRINFAPGALEQTGNPFDVALTDNDTFFAVEHVDPASGQRTVRLTRDGRFAPNPGGELVTMAGYRVLDVNDQPIVVDPTRSARFDDMGRLLQDGVAVARLQVARLEDPQVLTKAGESLFVMPDADPREVLDTPQIHAGYLEASGADPIQTIMQLVAATKAATGSANMVRYHDLMMDRAINTLGRVNA